MKQDIFPVARQRDIVVQTSNEEVLVYDLTINKVLCLNKTSAAVWNFCDGKTNVFSIAQGLNLPEELVIFAIDDLHRADLLEKNKGWNLTTNLISRRNLVAKFGKTAIALPLIMSLVAPKPINAQSGCVGPTTQICTVGVGACQRTGIQTRTCVAGVFTSFGLCSAIPGSPSAEIPGDGIDNDCDGQVDE